MANAQTIRDIWGNHSLGVAQTRMAVHGHYCYGRIRRSEDRSWLIKK